MQGDCESPIIVYMENAMQHHKAEIADLLQEAAQLLAKAAVLQMSVDNTFKPGVDYTQAIEVLLNWNQKVKQ